MLWFLGGWIHELLSEVTECPLSSLTGWGTQRSPELSTEGGHLGRGGPGAAMGPAASRPGAEWTDPLGRTWPGREANTLKSWAGHQTPELHGAPHVPAHPSGWHQGANSIPQLGRKTGTQVPSASTARCERRSEAGSGCPAGAAAVLGVWAPWKRVQGGALWCTQGTRVLCWRPTEPHRPEKRLWG